MRLFLFAGLIVTIAVSRVQAEPGLADAIAVIVNDVVITYSQVESSIASSEELLARQYAKEPEVFQKKRSALIQETIEELVARQLILNDFTNSGYNLPESVIDDAVESRIRQEYGDRATLTKTLQAQGITAERFRKNIRDNIIVSALREKHVSQELIVSPHKIEEYYKEHQDQFKLPDQVKLRMIVLKKSDNGPEVTKSLAQEILAKIQGGVPFKEMASVYSEGSQRGEGGDWGWVDRSVLRPELAKVAFDLKPGQRSGVIDTSEACYIMLVEDARLAHTKPLNEVRDEIEKTLLAQEQQRLQKQWIDRLKRKAFVRYF
ncbi:MAG: peptidyl-prolyl cis-trans isomerase [Candidatus Omnitrophica bacterium]|nr:peptidyl-prolyl cis-trans isomerase [Candidatus Omnitrophota bacterium]